MATTHRLTSTIKASEFNDVVHALLSQQHDSFESREPLLNLIASQTPAKEKKIWKFYDANTEFSDVRNERVWKSN